LNQVFLREKGLPGSYIKLDLINISLHHFSKNSIKEVEEFFYGLKKDVITQFNLKTFLLNNFWKVILSLVIEIGK